LTGLGGQRVYLDWNATAPLRPEARAAMLQAMDAVGNPSSVHAEGRAARAIVERARAQVAGLAGCEPDEVVFTSGATEAAFLVAAQTGGFAAPSVEHDCVFAHAVGEIPVGGDGVHDPRRVPAAGAVAIQAANSETGVLQPLRARAVGTPFLTDATQALGKVEFRLAATGATFALASAHKLGGPKGTGALIVSGGMPLSPVLTGGGQEQGRRPGTENVVGIAGFGAAAEAARRDLERGVWERTAKLRDALEARLESAAPDLIIVGRGAPRLPNTACFALPGWPGETQVMQLDLAGFAVSAGSACSSGKVERTSRVLLAMGFDAVTASSALRVSIGPTTTEAEVMASADSWIDIRRSRNSRAA
jgi:cysteine desulfurase